VEPVVEIWGFRKENSDFLANERHFKKTNSQKSFACVKIIFFRLQKCKNWSQKKKQNKTKTVELVMMVFLFSNF
jgi:hypothetical protein